MASNTEDTKSSPGHEEEKNPLKHEEDPKSTPGYEEEKNPPKREEEKNPPKHEEDPKSTPGHEEEKNPPKHEEEKNPPKHEEEKNPPKHEEKNPPKHEEKNPPNPPGHEAQSIIAPDTYRGAKPKGKAPASRSIRDPPIFKLKEYSGVYKLKGTNPGPETTEYYSDAINMRDLLGDSWTDFDTVMEIGCGDGRFTNNRIIKIIEKFSIYYAVDIDPEQLQIASRNPCDPRVRYRLGDIVSICTFKPSYLRKFTKIISMNCFHNLKTFQKTGFENVYRLLAPNGVAHLLFITWHPYWSIFLDLMQLTRWREYIKEAPFGVPSSHEFGLGAENYRVMLEKIGFVVLKAEDRDIQMIFKSLGQFQYNYSKYCTEHLPPLSTYMDEIFMLNSLEVFMRNTKPDAKDQLSSYFKILILHIKKPAIPTVVKES